MDTHHAVGLIPARGGSKGVPGKNIKPLAGYPLIAFSIAVSQLSRRISRTIVSTDSDEIADIARTFGAEVPFLRPEEYATDSSGDIEFVRHFLDWIREKEGTQPSLIAHIRPTTPLREPFLIDDAIETLDTHPDATALRSVHEIRESPYKLMKIENGFLSGFFAGDERSEYYNLPRQNLPSAYQPNGYIDIIASSTVLKTGMLHGPRILPFITPDAGELDRPEDFDYISYMLGKHDNPVYTYLCNTYPAKAD